MAHPDYRAILKRGWAIIVGAIVIGGLASFIITITSIPQYTSTATLLFSVREGASPTDLNQGAQYTVAQMGSLAELATSPLVLESVNRDLGLNESRGKLAGQITASVPADTVILNISATTTSAQLSQQIASSVAAAVSQQAESQSPTDTKGNTLLRSVLIESAVIPSSPSSPNLSRNLAAGVLIGLIVGVLVLIIREALDRRIRTAADVAEITERPLLAIIGRDPGSHEGAVLEKNPSSDVAENYRRLRMNLEALDPSSTAKSIVVTSSVAGEGKSTVSINLALAYVEAGARVVLVDANLRHPGLTAYSGKERMGLSDSLDGIVTTGSVLVDYGSTGLHILAAGSTYKNPGGLLSSPNLAKVIAAVKKDHDIVIFDSADVTSAADAAELAKSLDGVILVADLDHVRGPQVSSALDALDSAGASVLGVVGNRAAPFHGYSTVARAKAPASSAPAKASPAKPSTASAEANSSESAAPTRRSELRGQPAATPQSSTTD